ncbi:MAG: glutamate racemase [Akkermansiaceae bacterium]|nr:glutamate racemase [Akkermansiaceae bacterium]
MRTAPLGIFDSGVGGLTVVRAVQTLLPAEDIIYLGDTARLPYGSKSPETIRQFAHEDIRFLLDRGVKAVVVACNTVTAHALPSLQEQYRIPIIGVIEPGVVAVLSDPGTQRVGIIATRGTVGSHAYQHALAQRRTGLIIHATPAPLLVPLVEENWLDHPSTHAALHTYLDPMVDRGIDTLLLGCTHYPLLVPMLRNFLPPGIRIVDPALTCAELVKADLTREELLNPAESGGKLEIHLTDLSEQFEDLSRLFLARSPGRISRVVL